jgi:hypothetical protein
MAGGRHGDSETPMAGGRHGDAENRLRVSASARHRVGSACAFASPGLADLVRLRRPRAVLFDTVMRQPDFAVSLLRQQPNLLLIGINPETHQALVWSGRQAAAIEAADLLNVIRGKHFPNQRKERTR